MLHDFFCNREPENSPTRAALSARVHPKPDQIFHGVEAMFIRSRYGAVRDWDRVIAEFVQRGGGVCEDIDDCPQFVVCGVWLDVIQHFKSHERVTYLVKHSKDVKCIDATWVTHSIHANCLLDHAEYDCYEEYSPTRYALLEMQGLPPTPYRIHGVLEKLCFSFTESTLDPGDYVRYHKMVSDLGGINQSCHVCHPNFVLITNCWEHSCQSHAEECGGVCTLSDLFQWYGGKCVSPEWVLACMTQQRKVDHAPFSWLEGGSLYRQRTHPCSTWTDPFTCISAKKDSVLIELGTP